MERWLHDSVTLEAAQRELTASYANGAPGVLVSGLVWIVAGLVLAGQGVEAAFAALFFGGMLIQPSAMLIPRLLLGARPLEPGNPLNRLGVESVFILFAGILIGYSLLDPAPLLAFPSIALVVGARYCLFRTLYGDPLYWGLGAAIAGAAIAAAQGVPIVDTSMLVVVGAIEVVFAILLFARWKQIRPA